MYYTGQSNLATTFTRLGQNTHIRSALNTTSKELVTGEKSDLFQAAGGDLGKLYSINRMISRLEIERDALGVATSKASISQLALDRIHDGIVGFGPELLAAVERGDEKSMNTIGHSAEGLLKMTMASINTRYGRHSLFSGAAVDQPALASPEVLIADISNIISVSVDINAAIVAIDDYFFSAGGEFETNIYMGAANDAPPFQSASGIHIDYAVRGDADEVREVLRALTIAAVASDGSGFSVTQDQKVLLQEAAMSAMSATDDLIMIRTNLGNSEANLSEAEAHNQSKSNRFELERLGIMFIDPYESATKLEMLTVQLESVYALTARLSKLSITNYLR